MQQFQSLQRLLMFYALTLLVMLGLYYFTLFYEIKEHSEQQSIDTFYVLQHEVTEHAGPSDSEIKKILKRPAFDGASYQLVFMMPSGQTYIHRYTRPNEPAFSTVTFPSIASSSANHHSAYTLNSRNLTGVIKLKSGHQVYLILRHRPLAIEWVSYRYWLLLMTAIILFISALLYVLNRRTNWEQLLLYTDRLSSQAKEAYAPPPFLQKKSTTEFLRLGHALSRVSYQLHNDYRRIKTLKHRLERLVDQAPLPMLMIMRHGQISFFNTRFEHVFMSAIQQSDRDQATVWQLTDFFTAKDEATQHLLQKLSSLRVTRTFTVYAIANHHAYQLHITPWFGEHGQIHGFTVLLNNISDIDKQTQQLQQQNQQLQRKLDELNALRSDMGHKLRVPLETIIDTLEPIDPAALTAEQNATLSTLIRTSQHMLTTLNDTLDIGGIEVRKTRLSIEPVDIYKLGQSVNDVIIKSIRQQGLELLYFFSPDNPRCIDTDDVRLRQILINLLQNAITFTTSGYVALTIDTVTNAQVAQIRHERLLPSNKRKMAESYSHWVRFSVEDTGVGMDANQQRQLLMGMDQSSSLPENTAHKAIAATGLGLNSANSFAQLLGGFIECSSTVGQGSTFYLYLPCRHPNYQPVYFRSPHLTDIHFIAILKQTRVAEHLQRLADALSIPATIYTSIDSLAVQRLSERLTQEVHTLAPVLLLDYEYYDSHAPIEDTAVGDTDTRPPIFNYRESTSTNALLTSHRPPPYIDSRLAINSLLANTALPKLLFSMQSERRIPSILLDQCEGFLAKPLDGALLISELMRVTLPARLALSPTQKPTNEQAPPALTVVNDEPESPLILVVEDSMTNQKIACKMLSKLGYRSVVAENGEKALAQLQEQRQEIALVLMDCRMPVMDGLQATQLIRAQGDDIPIVALTANNSAEDRDACMQAGMDEFLAKPINKNELQTVLQRLTHPSSVT